MNWQTGTPPHSNPVLVWVTGEDFQPYVGTSRYTGTTWKDTNGYPKPDYVTITHWCEITPPTQ